MFRCFSLAAGRLCLAALVITSAIVSAQAQADPLRALDGKTIRFIVGGSASGSTGLYGRALADALQIHLPTTTIYVQNVSGGGGSAALAEVESAKSDTISLVVIHNAPIYNQLLESELGSIKLGSFHWIGALTNNQRIAVVAKKLDKTSIDELRTIGRQLIVAAADAGGASSIESFVVSALTGLGAKVISGVEEDQRSALILSGDVDLIIGSYVNFAALIESGDVVPVLQIDRKVSPPGLEDVPTLAEALPQDTKARSIVELMETLNVLGRIVVAAPSTDPETVNALRAVFDEVTADPKVAELFEDKNLLLAPTSGAEVASRYAAYIENSEVKRLLKAYVDCGETVSDDPSATCPDFPF